MNGETHTPSPGGSPLHGFRGAKERWSGVTPCGFVVGLNRLAGARGSEIATEAGLRLGWPVYRPEMIDFLARDEAAQHELLAEIPQDSRDWIDQKLQDLALLRQLSTAGDNLAVARVVYILGMRGQAVIIGRAAGFLLPRLSTLHVRVVAPMPERVAYMAQWQRLTEPEAREEVKNRDERRTAFLRQMTDAAIDDAAAYDLVLNSGSWSVEASAELIVRAVEAKQSQLEALTAPPSGEGELTL